MAEARSSSSYLRRVLVAAVVAAALVAALALFWHVSQVLLVLFAATLFALWLDALARLLSDATPLPRPWALVVVLILLVALLVGFGETVGARLGDQISQLSERVPQALAHIQTLLKDQSWGRMLLDHAPAAGNWLPSRADLLGQISGMFSTALGVVVNVTFILLVGFYLAVSPHLYVDNALRLLPRSRRERGGQVLHYLGHALRWWLVGRMSAMAVVGVLTALALWAIGLPLVLALGLIAAVLSFVPFIGPVVSAVPAVMIGLLQSPLQALYVMGVYAGVQFVEGNLITPLIQERAVSLPPAVLLAAQLLMGVLFGLFGIVLATPLAVTAIVLVQMLYVEDVLGDQVEVLGERHQAL
ncbi:MAG TPA: AI-2E family transporter [Gammaproteobacteria bacterium]|nr:AI-2E family transporter [Gammaproteobacteria bacterium]